jgi:hypothetical protein
MADTLITLNEKAWNLVAENVTHGSFYRPLNMGAFKYFFTTRNHGDAAPTNLPTDDIYALDSGKARRLFDGGIDLEDIVSDVAIDVYIWSFNSDDDATDSPKVVFSL